MHRAWLELHAQNLGWPDDSIGRWGRSATMRDEIGHTAIFAGASAPDIAGWSDQFLRIRVARDALGEPAITGGVHRDTVDGVLPVRRQIEHFHMPRSSRRRSNPRTGAGRLGLDAIGRPGTDRTPIRPEPPGSGHVAIVLAPPPPRRLDPSRPSGCTGAASGRGTVP